jgi:hypothetical protein
MDKIEINNVGAGSFFFALLFSFFFFSLFPFLSVQKESRKSMRVIRSIWGSGRNLFSRKHKKKKKKLGSEEDEVDSDNSDRKLEYRTHSPQPHVLAPARSVSWSAEYPRKFQEAHERDDVDEDLEKLGKMVRDLKGMALEMEKEITAQGELIDTVTQRTDKESLEMMHLHRKMNTL